MLRPKAREGIVIIFSFYETEVRLKILIDYNEGLACTGLEAKQLANDLGKRTNDGFSYFGKQIFTF